MAIATPPTPPQMLAPPGPEQALPPSPPAPASPPNRSWWEQRSKFQKLLMVVGAILVALFVIGRLNQPATPSATQASSSASQSTATTAPTATIAPTASAVPTARAAPKATVLAPAACVAPCGNANGYTLTINSANRNAPTDEFSKPEPGTHLVIVTMTFKNGSNDTQRPDSFCCRLTDSLGATRSEAFSIAPGCESWQGVDLAKGGSLGPKNMCFAAAGDPNAPLTLVWSPSFGASDVSIRF